MALLLPMVPRKTDLGGLSGTLRRARREPRNPVFRTSAIFTSPPFSTVRILTYTREGLWMGGVEAGETFKLCDNSLIEEVPGPALE